MKKKLTIAAIALCLLVAAGGTFAFLTDKTAAIENTFTIGDINITLTEEAGGTDKEFKMVPGKDIVKDPVVTVLADSEECWLFVKAVPSIGSVTVGSETLSFDDFLEWQIASGWTALDGVDNVYYRSVPAANADQAFGVIKDNTVTVDEDVTSEMMEAFLDSSGNVDTSKLPKLTFKAYACQKDGIETVTDAWAEVAD